jgi:hypothetical protein
VPRQGGFEILGFRPCSADFPRKTYKDYWRRWSCLELEHIIRLIPTEVHEVLDFLCITRLVASHRRSSCPSAAQGELFSAADGSLCLATFRNF